MFRVFSSEVRHALDWTYMTSDIAYRVCSIPNEPLVFVHVALVKGLADSMKYINDSTGSAQNERQADTAIFYSISSTQPGLQVRG